MKSLPDDFLLRERDAAELLGVSHYLLQRWRCYGGGPKWIRVGGKRGRLVRYRRRDIEAFIDANTVDTTVRPRP